MNIVDLNTNLVKKELKSLYCITKGINEYKDNHIIFMTFYNYLILLTIEVTDYINMVYSQEISYNLKSKLKTCRAKLKEYSINADTNTILKKIEQTNIESLSYYSKDLSKVAKALFKSLITNIGIYKYKNKIISNTFLISKNLKSIIYKNNEIYPERIKNSGRIISELIFYLVHIFYNEKELPTANINLYYNVISEDYNVTRKNKLFLSNIDKNVSLFLLDELSIVNFCSEIINSFDICDELKYRLFYLAFYRTYHNLHMLVGYDIDYFELKKILIKYKFLDNRIFRNAMFHYDITDKLENNEIIVDQMYYGLISKYLKVDEETFKNSLRNYLLDISVKISNKILRN